MESIRLIISLPQDDTYQKAQAKAAKQAGAELGVEIQILQADNDAVLQSQQLLELIQSRPERRPHAILSEPLTSTALARVAEAAVAAGIAWVPLNCDVDYLQTLRQRAKVPVFAVTRDHTEIGRIQGRQFSALLPAGGAVLYLQGPATSAASAQRTQGMESTKSASIKLKMLRSSWSEGASRDAVAGWLRLSTSRASGIDLVGCQSDSIARGVHQALQQHSDIAERDLWMSRPFTGIDGLPGEGQAWVNDGWMTATVVAGVTTGKAIEQLVRALRSSTQPPDRIVIEAESYPPLPKLQDIGRRRATEAHSH